MAWVGILTYQYVHMNRYSVRLKTLRSARSQRDFLLGRKLRVRREEGGKGSSRNGRVLVGTRQVVAL